MIDRRRFAAAAALLASTLGAAAQQPAQPHAWPTRPVTLLVPWPAGGPSDFVARQVQPDMQKALGQPIVVDNVGGVGGAMGVQKVLTASDGHTLLLGSPLELIVPPLTIASVKYKPTDLTMVGQIVRAPLVLIARKDLPAASVDDLLQLAARSSGGGAKPLAMANTGPGSTFHLVGERFAQLGGIELLHVPYKGSSPALTDLMGGNVDLMFTIFAGPIPGMIADGKVKAIGLAATQPLARFPAIGTLATHPKLAGFVFDSWAGVQVPRAMPVEAQQRIHDAVGQALRNPSVRQAFEQSGNIVAEPMTLAELAKLYDAEIRRYQAIAKSINLQAQQ